MVTPIAGPRIQLVNLCFHLVRHGIHKPSMSAEARPVQDRVTPFMDNAKFNSLNHNVYTAGIDQYHQSDPDVLRSFQIYVPDSLSRVHLYTSV
ncbi:hypothetical protein HBI73_243520 [Parastagonospora nodorum]|nr:hypothetical protein HBI73_243520 [Parastagonospora nodorum]